MFEFSTLFTFMVAVVVLGITPEPDMLLLVSRGMAQGWKAALFTALGFTLAGIIQIPLLALGPGSLVESSPVAFDILRYTGAGYLVWRGIPLLRDTRGVPQHSPSTTSTTPMLALRDGIVASLTNPKGLLFLLAFLPQFVEPTRGSVSTQLIVLGSIMKAVILGVESVIALASGTIGAWLARCTQLVRWQERVTGAVLIGLSVGLLSMGGGAALSRAA